MFVAVFCFILFLTQFIIIYCLYYNYTLSFFNDKDTTSNTPTIYSFQTDITFDEHTNDEIVSIDMNSRSNCTVRNLKKCVMHEPVTDCIQSHAECVHFEKPATYYFEKTETITVPANTDPKEGYALEMTNHVPTCNPYHGDLVLVSLGTSGPSQNTYAMMCECKHPGIIGKETIMGDCNKPYVCNGEVVNIDVPLDKIECKCEKYQRTIFLEHRASTASDTDNVIMVPYCKTYTVAEAHEAFDDWSHIVPYDKKHHRYIDTKHFHPNIRTNIRVKQLINPCTESFNLLTNRKHTQLDQLEDTNFAESTNTCTTRNQNYPVRTGILQPERTSDNKAPMVPIDGFLPTERYKYIRVSDHVNGVRQFGTLYVKPKFGLLEPHAYPKHAMWLKMPDQISLVSQVMQNHHRNIYGYRCALTSTYTLDRNYSSLHNTLYTHFGLPHAHARDAPSFMIGNKDEWRKTEAILPEGVKYSKSGIEINHKIFGYHYNSYGMVYSNTQYNVMEGAYLLSFTHENDKQTHLSATTG